MDPANMVTSRHEALIQAARTPEDLEHALAAAVACLEDLERRCERERAAVERAQHPQVWKDWKLTQLERLRQEKREPLVQHVATLHQRLTSVQLMTESSRHVVRLDQNAPARTTRFRPSAHRSAGSGSAMPWPIEEETRSWPE